MITLIKNGNFETFDLSNTPIRLENSLSSIYEVRVKQSEDIINIEPSYSFPVVIELGSGIGTLSSSTVTVNIAGRSYECDLGNTYTYKIPYYELINKPLKVTVTEPIKLGAAEDLTYDVRSTISITPPSKESIEYSEYFAIEANPDQDITTSITTVFETDIYVDYNWDMRTGEVFVSYDSSVS